MIKQNKGDDDSINNNSQELFDYKNEPKKKNQSNKNSKISNKKGGGWIKEAKEKYKQEKLNEKSSNTNKFKKVVNFDEIPVGGSKVDNTNFNIEIKVPAKKIQRQQNFETEIKVSPKIKAEFGNKDNNITNRNNYQEYDDNVSNQQNLERKNSMTSIITKTCDREMIGRSEFIDIPLNKENFIPTSNDINFSQNLKDNFDNTNFSNINKVPNYSMNNNIREKTETVIQLQSVQKDLENEIEMNKRLQGQIENYKSEFNNLREELVKKSDIINNLQQKISNLEKDLFLQGNQLIEAEAKPSEEHYEDIIKNYEEMKLNFDKAIEKIKFLTEENDELKEKIQKLEENNKKLKKEKKSSKKVKIIKNEKENMYYDDGGQNEEFQMENKFNTKMSKEQMLYEEKNIQNPNIGYKDMNREMINEEENKMNINNSQEKSEIKDKRSIIPEDNDIFGTKKNVSSKTKPRKIQEDGIPVIRRVEEVDNVKDIMVNKFVDYDDEYYNRAPIGKSKQSRIKRQTNETNTNTKSINYNNIPMEEGPKIVQSEIPNKNNFNEYDSENEVKEEKDEVIRYSEPKKNNNDSVKNILGNTSTSVSIFPSQIKSIANEREILNLESQLFSLQRQRDLINDEYLKYPEFPKKREEINARRKIEIKMEEMNKEISLQKLKIRELKDKK